MRRRNLINQAGVRVAIALGLVGCTVDPQAPSGIDPTPPYVDPSWYTVNNDPSYLNTRLVLRDQPLVVRRDAGAGAGRGAQVETAAMTTQLVLVGEVPAPVVDGQLVQASDIDLDPSFRIAAIAYGTAGAARAGALQVIDFADATHPRLVSEVLFHGADVHAVVRIGTSYYAGVARDGSDSPAAVEEFRTFSGGVFPTGTRRTLPSYVVTDLAYAGNDIVATCGDEGGGVAHLMRQGLPLVGFAPVTDARAVAMGPAGEVRCVNGGAGPALSRFALPGLGLLGRTAVEGFRFAETKGTIEVVGSYSYLGAGDGGFAVYGADGTLLDRVENRAEAAFMPDLAVTNAVSVRSNLAFMACGALGVQVVDLGRWNPAAPPGTTTGLSVLGTLEFPDGISSNMVKARSNVLLVAAGSGGVKLVRMTDAPSS